MGTLRVWAVGWVAIVVSSSLAGCCSSPRQTLEPESIGIHTYQIDGLTVQTGDLICTNTTNGPSVFAGILRRTFGMVIPGPVDHIAVYVGPGGRCVEAGAKLRVITFDVPANTGDEAKTAKACGMCLAPTGLSSPKRFGPAASMRGRRNRLRGVIRGSVEAGRTAWIWCWKWGSMRERVGDIWVSIGQLVDRGSSRF